jgi:hypothetical protein
MNKLDGYYFCVSAIATLWSIRSYAGRKVKNFRPVFGIFCTAFMPFAPFYMPFVPCIPK